ncbi:peptidoglycan-binding domain-containing protein [Streptomyces sp. FXJ1.172]|uniref:peptidoglycan-binding domain-containing protein n=1 Tax=Streptomyces sp. FXJ1.172 TaxID=710705 RepID=UPI0007D03AB2|nr:peptidoglycan-binding domain-containing protein [Streptomyces sp. FXJ1.172]WEO99328.1 peptidoglycan-binding domain-containing protein [Streptomyces sp. FXJ1.172]
MFDSVHNFWIQFNDPLEGRVNYMYLDQKGWVSTGIGNKIDETAHADSAPTDAERSQSLAEARELHWIVNDDGSDATADQVAADWDTVKGHLEKASEGHNAFQPPMTKLHLDDSEIDRNVFAKLDQMESVLLSRSEFSDFASWPANAQLATLSMCWALGPTLNDFPMFRAAVANHDWKGAADQCHFTPDEGTIQIRNKLDREHFQLAQLVADQGQPVDQIAMQLSDVFDVQGALLALGFKPGRQDGADGPQTQAAVQAFQTANGLDPNGRSDDPATVSALSSQLANAGFNVLSA